MSKLIKLNALIAFMTAILQLSGCVTMTPLTTAAMQGDVASINRLLNKGANVNEPSQGYRKSTPLGWSLYNCNFDAAELLLKKGAYLNSFEFSGLTPLYIAISYCKNVKPSFIEHLIQKGADVNYKDKNSGYTSLHHAIANGSLEVAKILIRSGVDINASDNSGATPLILAAQYNSLPMAKLLLERGSDVNVTDSKRKNAMSYSTKEMIILLQSADHIRQEYLAKEQADKSGSLKTTLETQQKQMNELATPKASVEAQQKQMNELATPKASLETQQKQMNELATPKASLETQQKQMNELSALKATLEAQQEKLNKLTALKATLEAQEEKLNRLTAPKATLEAQQEQLNKLTAKPRPVTLSAIENALQAKVDSRLIVEKISEKGVDFELNKENRRKLSNVKADKSIINAITEANKKKNDSN